ncbi:Toxin CdiA [Labeo rohita]|uniref:Toxin CdiA n=1 Tax=Labeo rohita TaxID=84645 RepID=A0ABQ8MU51_LABRO|nr:Toxin CdiA [Labeo rohita]
MDSEDRIEKAVDIYISAEAVRDMKHKDKKDFDATITEAPKHRDNSTGIKGTDGVKTRSSTAAVVCLLLVCVLLLTAVIVLCVHIHTKTTNYTQERQQLLINMTNLTEERDQLLIQNKNLTNERKLLIFQTDNLMNESNRWKSEKKELQVYFASKFFT